jgi:hypothetical protein
VISLDFCCPSVLTRSPNPKEDVGSYVGQHRNESDDNRKSQTSQVLGMTKLPIASPFAFSQCPQGAILDSDESFYCNEEPEWERLVGQYGNESNDNGKSQTQVLGMAKLPIASPFVFS